MQLFDKVRAHLDKVEELTDASQHTEALRLYGDALVAFSDVQSFLADKAGVNLVTEPAPIGGLEAAGPDPTAGQNPEVQ